MRVYCPNCGGENEGAQGSKITCVACTASFDVPGEHEARPATRAPVTPSPLGGFPGAAPPPGQGPVTRPPPPGGLSSPAQRTFRVAAAKPNTLAIISLASGVLCCVPFGFIALGTGLAALKQIEASEGREQGRNIAIVGIVLGSLGLALTLLGILGSLFK